MLITFVVVFVRVLRLILSSKFYPNLISTQCFKHRKKKERKDLPKLVTEAKDSK